jgi:hypothetical protein
MDKQALAKFAPEERKRLREAVQKRLSILGITEKSQFNVINEWLFEQDGIFIVNDNQYTDYKRSTFEQLFKEYQQVGYDTLVEEITYTWFNRLIAIRYMEVKDVLPDFVKILGNNGQTNQPEILNDFSYLSVEKAEIESLKMNNQEEAAYRKLFLAAANKLGDVMPFLFETLQDWTELVLPERMLEPGGIIERIVTNEGLTNSFQEGVEAIGWLYQYYISELKEKVMEMKKVEKEYVPARTQIFTPKWIVKYMVENSLGQLWFDANPNTQLKNMMKYHIEVPSQTNSVKEKLQKIRYQNTELEELTFLDPAVGSGHILSYAYDLFYEMYLEEGYSKREIPQLILEKNLYGIDIDDRAAQLAAFTLTMKAADSIGRSYWRNVITPNIISIQQSNTIDRAYIEQMFTDGRLVTVEKLMETYHDAKEYGSLLNPDSIDVTELEESFLQTSIPDTQQFSLFNASYGAILDPTGQTLLIQKLIKQQKLLVNKYDVVVTNPPYMGNSTMSKSLSNFAKKMYPESKADLFAMFMERIFCFTKENGFCANVTMQSWMFLTTYADMRKRITENYGITTLLHMGNGVMGIAFGTAATVFRKYLSEYSGQYLYVTINDIENDKPVEFPIINERYKVANSRNFLVIPGSPIAYWANDAVISCFESEESFESIAPAKKGLDTNGESEKFFRYWFEVNIKKFFGVGTLNVHESKWFEINKGGAFRRWFGNRLDVINYENNGFNLKNKPKKANIRNEGYYFKESLTYGVVTSSKFSFRKSEKNSLFDQGGPNCFPSEKYLKFFLALGNSKVIEQLLAIIAPTLNFTVGDINKLPVILPTEEILKRIDDLSGENIFISQNDWNSFEISWDFSMHPFIKKRNSISLLTEIYSDWERHTDSQFVQLKSNEEELNDIFIKLYGLEDTLTSEIPDKEITIRKAERLRDTKSFLSYFVGCLLGRYSLDEVGIAYAGGNWDAAKYKKFVPSKDGMVTFTDEKILPDEQDIFERFKQFLIAIYGQESLMENLAWIAEGLGKKNSDTVESTIRNYFMKEFIKDHIKIYQTRPIYWLIDSGKQNGMQTLVYIHRYTPQTMGLAMQNHFIPLLTQWRNLVRVTEAELDSSTLSMTEKREKIKLLSLYTKRSEELADFQDSLNEAARQEVSLDLDDGVKLNYQKLANVLYPIKF